MRAFASNPNRKSVFVHSLTMPLAVLKAINSAQEDVTDVVTGLKELLDKVMGVA
jgi:hypothetical protein